jgi:Tuberculosis necrotizing toxin
MVYIAIALVVANSSHQPERLPKCGSFVLEALPYSKYRVVKPFEVNSGGIAPAFNQLGLGTQYELPVSMNTLVKRGIIEKPNAANRT